MNNDHYSILVHWSDEDGGFIATVPDLPGCSAFGLTRDTAASEACSAIDAWIEAAAAAGNPIPAPSRAPTPTSYSGKVLVRMPRHLHRDLSGEAERQGVSLNQFMVYVLTDGIARIDHASNAASARSLAVAVNGLIRWQKLFDTDSQNVLAHPEGFGKIEVSSCNRNLVFGGSGHA